MFIRRANLAIKSLAVGFSYGPGDFNLNIMYYGGFMEPLPYLGRGFKKLKLVGLDLIGRENLTPVFAICFLTNLVSFCVSCKPLWSLNTAFTNLGDKPLFFHKMEDLVSNWNKSVFLFFDLEQESKVCFSFLCRL
ncbi:unnamed protein product [Brassica rapa]|uniref:Uncharacterized protein n=1 Tax=Brassica campestris TaxID=3711 RepID=A0A3P5YGN3_BRACM|nr:unnamed protein product [Brassica rapa]VDC60610.1 unnamed protein product [Brassica rapa]